MKERKDNLYDIFEFDRFTDIRSVKKAFRDASLKYHPDKNKSPEARKIYYSLNDNIETLKNPEKKEIYDYYQKTDYDQVQKPTGQSGSQEEYENTLFFQKVIFSIYCIPFYLAWIFIPLAYLDKKRRWTKVFVVFFVGS